MLNQLLNSWIQPCLDQWFHFSTSHIKQFSVNYPPASTQEEESRQSHMWWFVQSLTVIVYRSVYSICDVFYLLPHSSNLNEYVIRICLKDTEEEVMKLGDPTDQSSTRTPVAAISIFKHLHSNKIMELWPEDLCDGVCGGQCKNHKTTHFKWHFNSFHLLLFYLRLNCF